MSLPQKLMVTCKKCGSAQSFTAWQSLNAQRSTEEKQALMNGTLNRFTCGKCGHSANVVYPMLYHDMTRRLMFWLSPGPDEPDLESIPGEKLMADYTFRIVATQIELVEKILVFEHALDDRVIEFTKLLLRAQATSQGGQIEGKLLFAKADLASEGGSIYFEQIPPSGRGVKFSGEAYQKVCQGMTSRIAKMPPPATKWMRIDQEYAKALLVHQGTPRY